MNLLKLYSEIQPSVFWNKISVSKIAMIFNGCGIVSPCCLDGSSKQSNMNLFPVDIYCCSPMFSFGPDKEAYSTKSRLIVFMNSVIHGILGTSYFSKIFSSTVKTIVIAMIYFLSLLTLDYQLMKIYGFSAPNICSRIPCVSDFICIPFITTYFICIGIVYNCRFALRELYYNHFLIVHN